MAILNAFSILPASPSKPSRSSTLFALGFVMSLSTGLANVSLKYNRWDMLSYFHYKIFSYTLSLIYSCISIGFYQMSKIAVTPSIVLAEFILYKKKVSVYKVTTLLLFCCLLLFRAYIHRMCTYLESFICWVIVVECKVIMHMLLDFFVNMEKYVVSLEHYTFSLVWESGNCVALIYSTDITTCISSN